MALGVLAVAWLLWAGRDLLFIVFFGVLVALFLSVFVDRLTGLGMPRIPATLAVLLTLAALATGFFLGLWPLVREQLAVVVQDLPEVAGTLAAWVQEQYEAVSGQLVEGDRDLPERLQEGLSREAATILGGAMPVLNSIVGALTGAVIVLAAGIYIAVSPDRYRKGLIRLVPPRYRERVDNAFSRTADALRRWMLGTLINMILVGLMTAVGLWLLDVPAALALALIAGALEFVPLIGPLVASVPAIAVALTVSPTTALWVALLYVIVQQIEGNVTTPLVMKGAAELPPALTLLFQSFMAIVFGLLGLILAVPILAAGMVLVPALYVEPLEEKA